MNNLLNRPVSGLFLSFLLFILLTGNAFSQRCGDGVYFNVVDGEGLPLSEVKLKVTGTYADFYFHTNESKVLITYDFKYPVFYHLNNDTVYETSIDKYVQYKDNDKDRFYISTHCSMLLMRVIMRRIETGETMQLDIYNVHGDIPLKTDKITFSPGKYDIDLHGFIGDETMTKDADGAYIIRFDKFTKY